jgi:hypothetical protein
MFNSLYRINLIKRLMILMKSIALETRNIA